jgi:steroid 5-alpha reductase family enzyme
LGFIRQGYVFSLGYGLAAAAVGGAVLGATPPATAVRLHAALVTAYGVRLFAFLLWRQAGQDAGYGWKIAALDKVPRPKRAPIVVSTALFYALMTSPLLWHLQSASALGASHITTAGCAVAAAGLLVEAVADLQKSLFKISLRASGAADRPYTGGLYSRWRHANYAGEVLFWFGSTLAGLPALAAPGLSVASRAGRLVTSALGLFGICFIMLSATARLERKQAANAATLWPVLLADGELDSFSKYRERSGELLPKLF